MSIQTVNYISCQKLNCGCCGSAVVLCVDPTIVAPKACPASEDEQTFQFSYIYAEVCGEKQISNVCGAEQWMYTFKFDDDQLENGTVLTSNLITGVICNDCLVNWVQEATGSEVSLVTDLGSGVQNLVSQHGCQYPIANTELSAKYLALNATALSVSSAGGPAFSDLITYIVPANTLANRRRILFTGWGLYAANEAMQLRIQFGGTTIFLNSRTPVAIGLDFQWKISGQILFINPLVTVCEVSYLTDEDTALEPLTDLNIVTIAVDETVNNILAFQAQATTPAVIGQYGLVVDRIEAP